MANEHEHEQDALDVHIDADETDLHMREEDVRGWKCPVCLTPDSHRVHTGVELDVWPGEGTEIALVPATVAVCSKCGHRWIDFYDGEVEGKVAKQLRSGDLTGLAPVGTVYRLTPEHLATLKQQAEQQDIDISMPLPPVVLDVREGGEQ